MTIATDLALTTGTTKGKQSMNVPVLSFFTGAGFLDLGFMRAGFNVTWRNEFDPQFVRGFEHGVAALTGSATEGKIHNIHSIIDVGPNQIAREAFHNTPRPEVFGIIGGPPCPDFSVGGKNRGQEGERGKLSQVFVNRILELQPTFFLFENVPGLLRTHKHRLFLMELMKQLSEHYLVDLRILSALEYGVPQDRERVFLVGFQKRWLRRNSSIEVPEGYDWLLNSSLLAQRPGGSTLFDLDPWFPWHTGRRFPLAKTKYQWPDRTPFGQTPEKPDDIPDELMVGPLICDSETLASLPNGADCFIAYSDKFTQIAEGDVSRKSFKRLHRWRYSPAAAYGNNEVHLHPTEPRRLTVREALRIQTVPDEYALPPEMPLSHKFKTIGNGVPVKLAYCIARSFAQVLGGEAYGSI
jgi:DNA (cytosine-5)-methyltransferase 1